MTQATQQQTNNIKERVLHMAFDLGHKEWKIAFGIRGGNPREIKIPARNLPRLNQEIAKAKRKFMLPDDVAIVSCYESGRDGFWIHRYLVSIGVENIIVDPASIEVNRRKRRRKTDRLDARKLLIKLIRHFGDEKEEWSIVRIPSIDDEDDRRLNREYNRLKKERNAHSNRIKSLLVNHGIVAEVGRNLPQILESATLWDGSKLGRHLKQELLREYQRWLLLNDHIKEVEQEQRIQLKEAKENDFEGKPKLKKVDSLESLYGIGEKSSWPLVHEFFWRTFDNRREVGAAAGLTGTPYNTGNTEIEQGISKAGNSGLRRLMVELSWFWIRYQPESKITLWFNERFANGSKRQRRVGIVGVARKLLIALWKYLEFGEVPEGARFKAAA